MGILHRAVLALLLIASAGCSRPADVLASFGSATLIVADLDAYLLSLPEAERQVPPGADPAVWMEEKLRLLAVERVLEGSDEMARLQAGPDTAVRRLWQRSAALASALLRQLVNEVEPTAEEVTARAQDLAEKARDEPLLNFQHVYFRLDLAKTPRQKQEVRQRAEAVAARARSADADFAALVREHSDSADAATGGLVVNARLSDLEEVSRRALEALGEDDVSPVVESRTGLHVFRLLRRLIPLPPTAQQLESGARNALLRENVSAAQIELLERLRGQVEVRADTPPWKIGRWMLDAETIERLLPDVSGDAERQHLVDRFLLAEEAVTRGLETSEMTRELDRQSRSERLDRVFGQRREQAAAEVGEERLRPFYDGQPALFSKAGKVRLELLFVPQGVDAFATQQHVEAHVSDLKSGASFAELARRISRGPGADDGGDLGFLEPGEYSRLGPAVSAVVPELEPGEIAGPIYCTDRILSRSPWLLRGGFAVLRLKERVGERPRSFEEAIDDVRRAYVSERRTEFDQEVRTRILDEAGFKVLRIPDPAELVR